MPMGTEVKKCKEWLEEKYGLNICDRFGIIEKVIEYCKEHNILLIRIPYEKRDIITLQDLGLEV